AVLLLVVGLDDRDGGGDRVGLDLPLLAVLLAGVVELVARVVGRVLDPLLVLVGETRGGGAGAAGGEHPGVLRAAAAGGVHDHLPARQGDAGEPAGQHPDVVPAVQGEGAQI